MKKMLVLVTLSLLAAALLAACNIGYNAKLTNTEKEDFAGIEGFSYHLLVTKEDGSKIEETNIYSGDWFKCVSAEQTFCVNLSTEEAYFIDDQAQTYTPGTLTQTIDPFYAFMSIESIAVIDGIKWKKTGEEKVGSVDCEVFEGKANLIDQSAAIVYKVKDKNIYVRLLSYGLKKKLLTEYSLNDLELSGITDADAGIPEGYTPALEK